MKKNTKISHFCKYHQSSSLRTLPGPWNGSVQVLGLETSLPGTFSPTPKYCSQLLSTVTKLPVWKDTPVIHIFNQATEARRVIVLRQLLWVEAESLSVWLRKSVTVVGAMGGSGTGLMSVSSPPDALARAAFLIYFPVPVKAYGDCWAGQVVQREKAARKVQTGLISLLCLLYTDLSVKKY